MTVTQQCVYQMMFRNVYEFKKRLEKFGLVWNRTSSILLVTNEKSIFVSVLAQWSNILSNFAEGS